MTNNLITDCYPRTAATASKIPGFRKPLMAISGRASIACHAEIIQLALRPLMLDNLSLEHPSSYFTCVPCLKLASQLFFHRFIHSHIHGLQPVSAVGWNLDSQYVVVCKQFLDFIHGLSSEAAKSTKTGCDFLSFKSSRFFVMKGMIFSMYRFHWTSDFQCAICPICQERKLSGDISLSCPCKLVVEEGTHLTHTVKSYSNMFVVAPATMYSMQDMYSMPTRLVTYYLPLKVAASTAVIWRLSSTLAIGITFSPT